MKNKLIDKNSLNFGDRLFNKIREKETVLCLGLDPHIELIPNVFQNKYKINNVIYTKENIKIVEKFCISIIENCVDLVPVVKIQIAFFEQLGPEGMQLLSKLCKIIGATKTLCIVDAKRSDIGSTSNAYANSFFETNSPYPCDAITINPWLGYDSFEPFIKKVNYGKGIFILAHTSNQGSKDIQEKILKNGLKVYEHLAKKIRSLSSKHLGASGLSSIGVVAGATFKEEMIKLRKILPSSPFLIPGYGSQGGSIKDAICGLKLDKGQKNIFNYGIINSSRSLCFPEKSKFSRNFKEWSSIVRENLIQDINKINSIYEI